MLLSPFRLSACLLLLAAFSPAVAAFCPGLTGEPNILTNAERQAGWRLLFDGRTTEGWLEITGKPIPANCWTVEDGCLKALVRKDGFQDIRTVESFRNFELEFDWMISPNGNSGVKYLIQRVGEWQSPTGRQARAPRHRVPTGR